MIQQVRFESSPLLHAHGKWIVKYIENGKIIGEVLLFEGYTDSGWIDGANLSEAELILLEDRAMDTYRAEMASRVAQRLLCQMPPGSYGVIIPAKGGVPNPAMIIKNS